MRDKEVVRVPKKPFSIFKTEFDRQKQDISLMSNFFDNYIKELCLNNNNNSLQVVDDMAMSNIEIVKETIKKGKIFQNSKMTIVPDFDHLDEEIKDKIKKGIYKIGASKQVEGNLRPTIVDENNIRVKDITLKKGNISNDTVSKLDTQIQMQKIYNKLIEIQDLQEYQLKRDRTRDFINPFLFARDIIVETETEKDSQKRNEKYLEADKSISQAIIAVFTDYYDTADWIQKCLKNPYKRMFMMEKYLKYLVDDLQIATKYVGVRMQLLDYLEEDNKAKILLEKYNLLLQDFFVGNKEKNKWSMIDIFQNYYPYDKNNVDMWYKLKKDFLMSRPCQEKDFYILSIDDVKEKKDCDKE